MALNKYKLILSKDSSEKENTAVNCTICDTPYILRAIKINYECCNTKDSNIWLHFLNSTVRTLLHE